MKTQNPFQWVLFVLALILSVSGCKTRPPEEVPPKPLWPVKEENFSGLRILHISTPKEVVSLQLFIDGGTENYREEKDGIDRLALETAVFGGTSAFSADAIARRTDSLGIRLSTTSTLDYSAISMTFLREQFDPAWELFSGMIMNPEFKETSFEEIRDREVAALKRGLDVPWWHLERFSRAGAFTGLNYGQHPLGSTSSLEALTVRETKAYFKNMLTKSRVLLVVSGPIEVDRVVDKLLFGMDGLPEGAEPELSDSVATISPELTIDPKPGFTQYLQALCAGPLSGTDDAVAFQVAMALLNDQLHTSLSVEQKVAPDVTAWFSETRQHYGWIRLSCKDPNESARAVNGVLRELLAGGFEEAKVERKKKALKTAWLLDREGAEALGARFGAADMRSGWQSEVDFLSRLEQVNKNSVDAVFTSWCKQWHWSVYGDQSRPQRTEFLIPLE